MSRQFSLFMFFFYSSICLDSSIEVNAYNIMARKLLRLLGLSIIFVLLGDTRSLGLLPITLIVMKGVADDTTKRRIGFSLTSSASKG